LSISKKELFPRSSGILLHPTSLPGPYGIGDLGAWAYRFIDTLAAAGQSVWQVLPLGPTGFAESPYQCFSAFAGNTNLISLDKLVEAGWLTPRDVASKPYFSPRRVNYSDVIEHHDELLSLAYDRAAQDPTACAQFKSWTAHSDRWWLDDYALFMALKEYHGGQPWTQWTEGEALREKQALNAARVNHSCRMAEHRFRQWVFDRQWQALRRYAHARGVRIIGDIPIYVAHDSSDVWSHPELFDLQMDGSPTFIAGVPPDYFSATGQRWGNPLYLWDEHRKTGYDWWFRRIKATLQQVDILRIDHFRAFDRYYKIPADRKTAQGGRWVNGPKLDFLHALRAMLCDELGYTPDSLPIIAEDLGDDLGDAPKLRDAMDLPGMKVLQFAFGPNPDERARFQPHNHTENFIVYTGTHDNNTFMGWWTCESSAEDRRRLLDYVGADHIAEPHWTLIEMGMQSIAHTFVIPLQDVLGGGPSTRMNRPGVPTGNWRWRCLPGDIPDDIRGTAWDRLRQLTLDGERD
jgi:4-alpha-glucanotransferase